MLWWAFFAEVHRAFYRRADGGLLTDRAAYALLVAALWAMVFKGIVDRGNETYDRYLFFGMTLALPLAAVGFLAVLGRYRNRIALGLAAIVASLTTVYLGLYPLDNMYTPIYVTRFQLTELTEVVNWLRASNYKNDAIVVTRLNWQSTYLLLWAPEFISRNVILSEWTSDQEIRSFINLQHPELLITSDEDLGELVRLRRIIGPPLASVLRDPVFTTSEIAIVDISSLIPR